MGQLIYAGAPIYGIPDSQLAYLDALTRHAFSEGKSFTVIIRGTADDGEPKAMSSWFAPSCPVQFAYEDYETIEIDRNMFDEVYEGVITSGVYLVGDGGPLPYEFTGERPGSSGE